MIAIGIMLLETKIPITRIVEMKKFHCLPFITLGILHDINILWLNHK